MSVLPTLVEWLAPVQLIAADDSGAGWLLAAGPLAGGAVYAGLFRYYRNTDKSHDFERETRVEAKPVRADDTKVDDVRRTKRKRIEGDNRSDHRERVTRVE